MNSATYRLRPYTAVDFNELVNLVQAFRTEMSELDRTGMQLPLSHQTAITYTTQLLRDASEREGTAIVAVQASIITGFIQGVIDRHYDDVLHNATSAPGATGWVGTLYVDPASRGQGIARSLIKALTAHFKHEGCASLRLLVLDSNHSARRLYESEGYLVSELEMIKPLTKRSLDIGK